MSVCDLELHDIPSVLDDYDQVLHDIPSVITTTAWCW